MMSEWADGIEALIDAVIDGRCDEAGLRRLEELVRNDPRVREAYLDQMRVHALLEWRHGRVAPQVERAAPPRTHRWWTRSQLHWGLTAVALIGALAILGQRTHTRIRGGGEVATLVEARGVVWETAEQAIAVNTRIAPRTVRCSSGVLRLAFVTGAMVTVEGPADFEILSDTKLKARRGRITARVAGATKKFTIETPTTVVVDPRTEFGVDVDASGKTDVVVFEGLVNVERPDSAKSPAGVKRLVQGEALSVDRAGLLSRIVAVERRPGDDDWSTGPSANRGTMIRSVGDNIRGLESSKYYQIVHHGLEDDAPAYVDRPHEWNGLDPSGLPAFLRGADYIMPFNDDKWTSNLEITVELTRAGSLFVFLDDREKPPAWLTSQFSDTGVNIGLDEGSWPDPTLFKVDQGPGRSINQVFSVWIRNIDGPGSIRLGALRGGRNNRAMYGIAAVARP